MNKELNIIIDANPFLHNEEGQHQSGSSTTLSSGAGLFTWEEFVIAQRLVPILTGTNKTAMKEYLTNQINLCEQDIAQANKLQKEYDNIIYCKSKHEEFWQAVCKVCFLDPLTVQQTKIIKRNQMLLNQLAGRKQSTNGVTPEQIAQAKQYPITSLVDFKRGFAKCPFHSESTASFHHNQKNNTARCFGACSKTYDSIALYQELNHCSFVEAVKKLQ